MQKTDVEEINGCIACKVNRNDSWNINKLTKWTIKYNLGTQGYPVWEQKNEKAKLFLTGKGLKGAGVQRDPSQVQDESTLMCRYN